MYWVQRVLSNGKMSRYIRSNSIRMRREKMYDGFPLDDEVNVRVAEESITHGKLRSVEATVMQVSCAATKACLQPSVGCA
jgi:hypothetical protein